MSKAEVIISISTGMEFIVTILIIITLILVISLFIILKRNVNIVGKNLTLRNQSVCIAVISVKRVDGEKRIKRGNTVCIWKIRMQQSLIWR